MIKVAPLIKVTPVDGMRYMEPSFETEKGTSQCLGFMK